MDETIKIIIGTVSGFLIAFLAEPIKIYFQNASKKKSLRLALYSELINNFMNLRFFLGGLDRSSKDRVAEAYSKLSKLILKVDVYGFAISQELYLFYQLKEANLFAQTYAIASTIIGWIESGKREERILEEAIKYLLLTKAGIEEGDLNRRTIDRIFGKGVAKKLVNIAESISNMINPTITTGKWYFKIAKVSQSQVYSGFEFYVVFNEDGTLITRKTESDEGTTSSGEWIQKGTSVHLEIAGASQFDGSIIDGIKMVGMFSNLSGYSAPCVAELQS
jgi:hypothetical protein